MRVKPRRVRNVETGHYRFVVFIGREPDAAFVKLRGKAGLISIRAEIHSSDEPARVVAPVEARRGGRVHLGRNSAFSIGRGDAGNHGLVSARDAGTVDARHLPIAVHADAAERNIGSHGACRLVRRQVHSRNETARVVVRVEVRGSALVHLAGNSAFHVTRGRVVRKVNTSDETARVACRVVFARRLVVTARLELRTCARVQLARNSAFHVGRSGVVRKVHASDKSARVGCGVVVTARLVVAGRLELRRSGCVQLPGNRAFHGGKRGVVGKVHARNEAAWVAGRVEVGRCGRVELARNGTFHFGLRRVFAQVNPGNEPARVGSAVIVAAGLVVARGLELRGRARVHLGRKRGVERVVARGLVRRHCALFLVRAQIDTGNEAARVVRTVEVRGSRGVHLAGHRALGIRRGDSGNVRRVRRGPCRALGADRKS